MSDEAPKKLRIANNLPQPIYIRMGRKVITTEIFLFFEFHDRHPGKNGTIKVLYPHQTMVMTYKPSAKLRFAVCLSRRTYRQSRKTDYGWLYRFIGYMEGAN